ncbi:MAG: hypothetical protein P4L49_18420 [Desulfosporosinus sp.]|nr:hypothetical protein [Desulfosporosinus sp.]
MKTQPFSDFLYYHELARQIANGGQWGDTYTTVGYSVVLGFFYKLFGAKIAIAKGLNLTLSVMSSLLVLGILIRMNLSQRIRRTILLCFILFPMNIYYNSILATEMLFTSLLLLIIYIYLSDTVHKYWIIGLLTGIDTMIKPFFLVFFLVILLTELIISKKLLPSLRKGLIVLSVSILIISPWLYRNYKLMGEFTYVSNNGGIVLYINNNSQNKYGGWMPAGDVKNSLINLPEYKLANSTQKNRMLTLAAKQWIKSHPLEFLVLGMKRLSLTYFSMKDINYAFYGTTIPQNIRLGFASASKFTIRPIFILGIVSIFTTTYLIIRRKIAPSARTLELETYKNDIFLLLIFYMFTGVYFLTEGQSRYSFPLIFIIIYYFVMGLRYLKNALDKPAFTKPPAR